MTKENARPSRLKTPLFSAKVGSVTVSTCPARLIGGGVFTAAMLALVLLHTGRFFADGVACGGLLYGLCLFACVLLGGMTLLRLGLSSPRAASIFSVVVYLLLPIVTMTMVECLNGVFTWDWSPNTLILNYVLYFLFYGFVYICSGSLRLSVLIVDPLFFLLALTNHYVKAFRGTPFIPMDLVAAQTAANVAANYDFSFDYQIVIAIVMLAFLVIAGYKLRTPRMSTAIKVATRTFFATLIVSIASIYFFTDQYAKAGLAPDFWNQGRGFRNTGVVMNFCLNFKYLYVTKPSGYDPADIDRIIYDMIDPADADIGISDAADPPAEQPTVIAIMNESFADLGVLGDLTTNTDCMPFLRSLTENTVRGDLYVPVVGSGTSNTEFEFLTGVTTSFFPSGSNAYMLYMKQPVPSLVSVMGALGYTQLAFHPYYPSGWNRTAVYKNFGFTDFYSITTAIDRQILIDYQNNGYSTQLLRDEVEANYPGQNVLIRQYVSDSYNYRKIIEMFEQRDPDRPFFLFNVTMQNHGGYTYRSDEFVEDVYVTDATGQRAMREVDGQLQPLYPRTDQYLTLIKRSDEAFEELIDYFSQRSEPTVICMFGDHQPSIESSLVTKLLGAGSTLDLTIEQQQRQYITPFVIWANFDIEEREIERLSANYLSSLVLQTAGVQMSDYDRYLLKLSEILPVIDNVGLIDANGVHYSHGEKTPYDDLVNDYRKVVYNLMFDPDHRCGSVFSPN